MKHTKEAKSFPYATGVKDTVFYHYTNSEEVRDFVAKTGRVDEMLTFVRKNPGAYSDIYVAEDPLSSSSYGSIQVRITVKPGAKILHTDSEFSGTAVSTLLDDFFKSKKIDCYGDPNLLKLVSEESGISLIDYTGRQDWFQLIRTDEVEKAEVGDYEKK